MASERVLIRFSKRKSSTRLKSCLSNVIKTLGFLVGICNFYLNKTEKSNKYIDDTPNIPDILNRHPNCVFSRYLTFL